MRCFRDPSLKNRLLSTPFEFSRLSLHSIIWWLLTWILGSYVVILCVLTSCHIVISKQGDGSDGVVRSSRCVTGRRPRDMRITWLDLDSQSSQNRKSRKRYVADQKRYVVSDDIACKGIQALAAPGYRKKIREKKKSPLWVYVSPSISQT